MPEEIYECQDGDYTLSTDPARLDVDTIHRFLSQEAYWAIGRPRQVVEKTIRNSLCFGVYYQGQQAGFARLVTDRATFAWLCDVFILPEHRGRGVGKFLISCIRRHPELQGLRRWLLATRDAHGLYSQYGFKPLDRPESMMEILNRDVYRQGHP